MKTIIQVLFIACTAIGFGACKEEPETEKAIPSYDRRDRFLGNYSVKDDTGHVYTMTISKFDSGGASGKFIRILNYANMFDIEENFSYFPDLDSLLYNQNNQFVIGPHGPIKDRQGKTWDIFFGDQLQGNGIEENYLYGNTMVLYFELSNLPYYDHEAVPFHMQFHKHVATKIN